MLIGRDISVTERSANQSSASSLTVKSWGVGGEETFKCGTTLTGAAAYFPHSQHAQPGTQHFQHSSFGSRISLGVSFRVLFENRNLDRDGVHGIPQNCENTLFIDC